MDTAQLIHAAFPVSLALIALALGMRCAPGEALFLFREPRLLLRSLLAMNVVLPIVAVLLATTTNLHPAVRVALVALAVSPVPPVLPGKHLKLGARDAYLYGLLVAISILSIVLIPVTMALLGGLFGRVARIEPGMVARVVAGSVLAPLAAGMLIRHLWPAFAAKASSIASTIGTLVLVAALLVVLTSAWPRFGALIGDGTLLALMVFAAIALLVGHAFGGPDEDDRTVLALATASRHPGVAIVIGAALFPDEKLVPMAVVLYLLAGSIASVSYAAWRKRLRGKQLTESDPRNQRISRPR